MTSEIAVFGNGRSIILSFISTFIQTFKVPVYMQHMTCVDYEFFVLFSATLVLKYGTATFYIHTHYKVFLMTAFNVKPVYEITLKDL